MTHKLEQKKEIQPRKWDQKHKERPSAIVHQGPCKDNHRHAPRERQKKGHQRAEAGFGLCCTIDDRKTDEHQINERRQMSRFHLRSYAELPNPGGV
jgi:hypothetical protein